MFQNETMKSQGVLTILLALVSILIFSSCERVVVNSSENDELIASVANLQGGAKFKAIVPVIISKCATCHTHQGWYGFNETDYSLNGLVTAGTPVSSKMYYRLSTATTGPGPRNMPQGGTAAFTEDEVALLEDWITNFQL